MVAMSDFSTFSQMTCMARTELVVTHRDAVGVLLPDALGLGLALLEGVLVLELGAHVDGWLVVVC
jgi:hypothetical protein